MRVVLSIYQIDLNQAEDEILDSWLQLMCLEPRKIGTSAWRKHAFEIVYLSISQMKSQKIIGLHVCIFTIVY